MNGGWSRPIESLAEGVLDYQRRTNSGNSSRSEVIAALNAELLEQRVRA